MKGILALWMVMLGGCAMQMDRTYSLNYSDAEGRTIGTSMTLGAAKGFKK